MKLPLSNEALDEEDLNGDDDEYNRTVLLQARQRRKTEQIVVNMGIEYQSKPSISLSLQATPDRSAESLLVESTSASGEGPPKRVRLCFPPEKYADLDNSSTNPEIRTPKLTYR